jgi:diadenosine tetraphosphate (Ap4A) HIT family hydrolase
MAESSPCGVCRIHAGAPGAELQIHHDDLWLLRHHPLPAPLPGWLVLDSLRHVGGPVEFDAAECADLGPMLRRCSALVRDLTGCERVYAIAFGEGARHFHLHLIPRHGADAATESWRVADLYRQVAAGERQAADPAAVLALVERARECAAAW